MPGPWNSPSIRHAVWIAAALGATVTGYALSALPTSAAASNAPATTATAVPRAEVTRVPAPTGPAVLSAITIAPEPHPLAHLSARELQALAVREPSRLGSASIGRPNRGRLLNGVQLTEAPGIHVVNAAQSYGTAGTVRSIESAVAEVQKAFPETRALSVGDLSRRNGGYLRPHRSHQSGRDVDVGYYYLNAEPWYTKANAENLDRARTWALLKALVSQGNVEYVFMDRAVQQLLIEHALAHGESPEFLASLFESKTNRATVVRHARHHLTHLHVRFHDPIAEETGRRLQPPPKRIRRR